MFWKLALILVVGSVTCTLCVAQSPSPAKLEVTAGFGAGVVSPNQSIELFLNRKLDADEHLAIMVGTTDVSSLFTLEKLKLRYDASVWPLPRGDSLLVVYLTSATDWVELGRFILRVSDTETAQAERFGNVSGDDEPIASPHSPFRFDVRSGPSIFDEDLATDSDAEPAQQAATAQTARKRRRVNFLPTVTLSLTTQPAQSTFPDPQPNRATFTDLNIQASLKNESTLGFLTTQSSFDVAGSTFQQAALRFGTLGNTAPNVDLASYQIHFEAGRVKFDLGHFSYGTERHLVNNFSSRGIKVTVPFLKYFDLSAVAMNGTQLVGYSNFFGLDKRRHRLFSGTLGIELFPKRPGALRVEVGMLNAYFQPISGVNRGVITDTQRSRGISFRIIASDKTGRLHFESGFARSFFASPNDVTLSQGLTLVPLPGLSRNAHYVDASYQFLRGFGLSKTKKANLIVSFREENVAPLFRSLAAPTQADKVQYEVSATGSINEINAQFGHSNFHDNLRNIPSILRTLNGTTHASLAAPAASLLNLAENPTWLPRLAYSFDRVHAFGAAIPVNGGFELAPDAIPDLIGTSQTFGADWLVHNVTVGYSVNRSYQDNRQIGRQRSDQDVLVNTGRVGFPVNPKLRLNFDVSEESSANIETGRIDRTFRVGPGFSWQLSRHMGIVANLANTISGDVANTSHGRNTEFDAAWTYTFQHGEEGLRKYTGQFFLRYANHYSRLIDRLLFNESLRKNQTITANFAITFF